LPRKACDRYESEDRNKYGDNYHRCRPTLCVPEFNQFRMSLFGFLTPIIHARGESITHCRSRSKPRSEHMSVKDADVYGAWL
jgi:hypothetical protein